MKLRLFVYICCIIILCGCSNENKTHQSTHDSSVGYSASTAVIPTDEQVKEAFISAEEAFSWFELESLPYDNDTKVLDNNMIYYKVISDKFNCMSDMEEYLRTLFSDSIIQELMDSNSNYKDIDDKLYTQGCSSGSNIAKGEECINSINKVSDSLIKVTVYCDIMDAFTIKGTERHTFSYEYLDEKWVFTDFYLIKGSSGVGHGEKVEK